MPDALMKGAVKIGPGLGLIDDVVIDSHFVKRGRFGRLIEAVGLHPGLIGIGLGEDTGVLIIGGHFIETIGSNLVVIMDGHEVGHNNAAVANNGVPLSIEHMVMHVLAKGNVYDISRAEVLRRQSQLGGRRGSRERQTFNYGVLYTFIIIIGVIFKEI